MLDIMLLTFLAGALLWFLSSVGVIQKAFRISFIWGLAVLLLPLAVIAFVLRYPEDGRVGLFGIILGILLMSGAFVSGADRSLKTYVQENVDLEQFEPWIDPAWFQKDFVVSQDYSSLISNQAAVEAAGIEDESYEEPESGQEAQRRLEEEAKRRLLARRIDIPQAVYGFEEIEVLKAKPFIGSRIRMKTADGRNHLGRLTDMGTRSLSIEKFMQGGTISFSYNFRDIEKMEVYRLLNDVEIKQAQQKAIELEAQQKALSTQ